jgi:uncharacterized protein with HEPN domain
MNKSDKVYLYDIRDSLDEIQGIVGNRSSEEVLKDHGGYYGVLYLLAVIGEATGKLSEDFKKEYPDIPWDKMKGMRNVLIHEYAGVSFGVVWRTVNESLPKLRSIIEKAIKDINENDKR